MQVCLLALVGILIALPVSGQIPQEILRGAERANVSIQARIGQMDDLGRGVTQNDTEDVSWKRILIGAGVGLVVGFEIGWRRDNPDGTLFSWIAQRRNELECITHADDLFSGCLKEDHTARYRVLWSLTGIGAGAALGWFWPFGGRDDNNAD